LATCTVGYLLNILLKATIVGRIRFEVGRIGIWGKKDVCETGRAMANWKHCISHCLHPHWCKRLKDKLVPLTQKLPTQMRPSSWRSWERRAGRSWKRFGPGFSNNKINQQNSGSTHKLKQLWAHTHLLRINMGAVSLPPFKSYANFTCGQF
jgi:hypothetical protein